MNEVFRFNDFKSSGSHQKVCLSNYSLSISENFVSRVFEFSSKVTTVHSERQALNDNIAVPSKMGFSLIINAFNGQENGRRSLIVNRHEIFSSSLSFDPPLFGCCPLRGRRMEVKEFVDCLFVSVFLSFCAAGYNFEYTVKHYVECGVTHYFQCAVTQFFWVLWHTILVCCDTLFLVCWDTLF